MSAPTSAPTIPPIAVPTSAAVLRSGSTAAVAGIRHAAQMERLRVQEGRWHDSLEERLRIQALDNICYLRRPPPMVNYDQYNDE